MSVISWGFVEDMPIRSLKKRKIERKKSFQIFSSDTHKYTQEKFVHVSNKSLL